jgi:MFS family permease
MELKGAGAEGILWNRQAYSVFILLFLLYMFNFMDRLVVVSLFPFLKADWGLSDTQCGLLVSTVYWSIVVFTIPVSILVDRISRKKCIGTMSIVWSFATIACSFTVNFTQLFMARTLIGVGEAGYAPGGTAMISALFSEKKRSFLIGLWNAAIPIGSAVGVALGSIIAVRYGWRYAFTLVALPGLIIALLFFFIKDYKTIELVKSVKDDNNSTSNQKKMDKKEIIKEFIETPTLLFTYLGFAGNTFLTTVLLSWLPTYFNRFQNMPIQQASFKASTIFLTAIIGAPLGGFLADLWMKKRLNARLLFCAFSSILTSAVFFFGFRYCSGAVQYYTLLFGGLCSILFVSGASAVTQDVVHPGLRATSFSLCIIMSNLLGSSLGPLIVGALSDKYDIQTALSIASLSPLLACVLFLIGSRYYEKDLAKVEKIVIAVE